VEHNRSLPQAGEKITMPHCCRLAANKAVSSETTLVHSHMHQGLAESTLTHSQKGLRWGHITLTAKLCKTACNAGIDDCKQLRNMNLSEKMSISCFLIDS